LTAFRHFTANERDCEHAQKRVSGQIMISLDMQEARRRYVLDPGHNLTPEELYERRWAMALLDRALERLQQESRHLNHFDRLQVFLTGGRAEFSYSELASELGMSEGALKVSVHRLRQKFRKVLRAEIADMGASPEEVKEEMQYLLLAVSG
jgi:RNA polymerase sigma-70 factor (ECF subfamily)